MISFDTRTLSTAVWQRGSGGERAAGRGLFVPDALVMFTIQWYRDRGVPNYRKARCKCRAHQFSTTVRMMKTATQGALINSTRYHMQSAQHRFFCIDYNNECMIIQRFKFCLEFLLWASNFLRWWNKWLVQALLNPKT